MARSRTQTEFVKVSASVLLAVVVVALLVLWAVPAWLTPSSGLTSVERLKAMNDVRAPLVALLVAFGAGVTLVYTARTYRLNHEGHVTDRYSKAVDQLGNRENSSVRIGGVYALERIGGDSPKDCATILDVLGSFVRERSKALRERQDEPNEDVVAAIKVAGRLLGSAPYVVLDLRGVDLRHCDLSNMRGSQVDYTDAKMAGAIPPSSD